MVEMVSRRMVWRDSGRIKAGVDCYEKRLVRIYDGINAIIRQHNPDEIAIEAVFISKNPSTALKLGQARGVALLAAAQSGAYMTAYSPREVKKTVVGSGAAQKGQVQFMVKKLLSLQYEPSEDEADALALSITHGNKLQVGDTLMEKIR